MGAERMGVGLAYAHGKWAAADAAWCDLMDAAQGINQRADVIDALLRVLRRCHVELWGADHWANQRKRWSGPLAKKHLPAFQVSERELSRSTGLSRQRVRTALRVAEAEGLIVRLSAHAPRGEGRGCAPAVYTFACYVGKQGTGAPALAEKSTTATAEDRATKARAKWGDMEASNTTSS